MSESNEILTMRDMGKKKPRSNRVALDEGLGVNWMNPKNCTNHRFEYLSGSSRVCRACCLHQVNIHDLGIHGGTWRTLHYAKGDPWNPVPNTELRRDP